MDLNSQQLSILNALVTFSAEHIPGGLSVDEREVAQIVGGWALKGQGMVMTIHSVFCADCGGWEKPRFVQITEHEGHLCCDTCDEIIALVRTVEAEVKNE